jgi:ectoine hydroxylase-related dioxygenase (phytanoyl-CoA dioxygenase family)
MTLTTKDIETHLLPSEADVAFYLENGYWMSGKVLDDAFLEELREAMDRFYEGKYDTGKDPWGGPWKPEANPYAVRKTDQAHWSMHAFRKLVTHRTIGAIAAKLAQTREIRLWHDQLLYKPGQRGTLQPGAMGNVGWHQDRNYWQCTTDTLLTAWVAFDDVTTENGCMLAVPGSHKWGLLEGDFFNQDLESTKRRYEEATGREFRTVPLAMKAGHVSFHHCLTIHGSGPNVTDRPRRSLVLHLQDADACYMADSPNDNHMNALLIREQGGRNGDLFKGDLWPTLYEE